MTRALRVLLGMGLLIVSIGTVQAPSSGQTACDPSYPGQCIPSPPPDLDCAEVPFRDFPVLPPDPHNFDQDTNGQGCEGTVGKQQFVSSSTTTSSTTVAPSTTTTTGSPPTIPMVPADVPTAVLSGSSGSVTGELGSFAWPQPDGTTIGRIVDYVVEGPNPAQVLTVTQGETLTLQFQPALPVATLTVGVWPGGPDNPTIAVAAANPSRFVTTLAPGTHVISADVTFQGVPGRASYHFKLRVLGSRPAEPTQPGRIALTG